MAIVDLELPHHRYQIRIEPGLLKQAGSLIREVAPHDRAGLIADQRVLELHGPSLQPSLESAGYNVTLATVEPGEQHKTLATVAQLYDTLLEARLERKSPIIALGGGVAGDMTGFVAATYLRGVPFIQCPTTLLAMVDASVGGKTGVNTTHGKNLVGAFHQPSLVAIDTDVLQTLPQRELRCGLAECVKHGVIRSADRFYWLEENLDRVLALEPDAMVELVRWNVQIKADVVMADEKEAGERAHLNFGHTFAHAIEATAGYGHYEHGEAVALGMVAATRHAVDGHRCDRELLERITTLLNRIGLPTHATDLPDVDTLMAAMLHDKKVADGKIRLVLPDNLGAVSIVSNATADSVREAWMGIGVRA